MSSRCNVIISQDHDIFSNLALENWLYSNIRFTDDTKVDNCDQLTITRPKCKPVVLIWRNTPALVTGRHQNPWLEGRLSQLDLHNIKLARRHSGGGCVYHDMNNINISIIGHRDRFSQRQANLKFVVKVINDLYNIKCEPTERHDLVLSETGSKITGSAAKLGRFNCYHHFTLLVDTDTTLLYKAIRQDLPTFLTTKSSPSVRSTVQNLKDIRNDLTPEIVIHDLATNFSKSIDNNDLNETILLVNPCDTEFPGYHKMKQDLLQWNWIFGMTPKFTLEKTFNYMDYNEEHNVRMEVEINHGHVERIYAVIDGHEPLSCLEELLGCKFIHENIKSSLSQLLQVDESNLDPSTPEKNRRLLFASFFMSLINDLHD